MDQTYIEDEVFEKIDFMQNPITKGSYDNCSFIGCNFSGINLAEINFSECEMKDCNLSTATLVKTAFKDVKFRNCKMLGLRFDDCSPFLFSVGFENCILDLCSFYKSRLKRAQFINCSLKEVDFTEADLTGAVLDHCDLTAAHFERTSLEKADLRTAYNYSIDPEINMMKGAKFSMEGIHGLLEKYKIIIG